jgi:hypothetical protein
MNESMKSWEHPGEAEDSEEDLSAIKDRAEMN